MNFLNQNPSLSSFFNPVLFVVALIDSRCMSPQSASSPYNPFSMLFIHLIFLLSSFCSHLFLKFVLFPFHPLVGLSLCILHLLVDRIFCYFEISCFDCITLTYFGIV